MEFKTSQNTNNQSSQSVPTQPDVINNPSAVFTGTYTIWTLLVVSLISAISGAVINHLLTKKLEKDHVRAEIKKECAFVLKNINNTLKEMNVTMTKANDKTKQ
jgi:membrane protein YqaA with SNARE-associated domain